MTETVQIPAGLTRVCRLAGVVAILGIIGCVFGFITDPKEFFRSYLFAWVFWSNITLGCLLYVMMQASVRAAWGYPTLRMFEAGSKLLPLTFLLWLPILAGLRYLYPWAMPYYAHDAVTIHRSVYLNPTWYTFRGLIYFGIWILLASLLNTSSRVQDRDGDPNRAQFRSNLGTPGIVIWVLTVTFASTDWVMSLDPHWYSTIWGFIFCDGQALGGLALISLILMQNARTPQYDGTVTHTVTRDLGNLLLTFTMTWAYFAVSQWIIIWSGNLPDEIEFYLVRLKGQLLPMGTFIIIAQFFAPFLMLCSSRAKRTPSMLAGICVIVLIARVVEIFWFVKPMWQDGKVIYGTVIPLTPWDGIAFLTLGGIWLAGFGFFVSRNALFPRHTYVVPEVLENA